MGNLFEIPNNFLYRYYILFYRDLGQEYILHILSCVDIELQLSETECGQ